MKHLSQTLIFIFLISSYSSCHPSDSKDKIISDKNECYKMKLQNLKQDKLYTEVMTAFNDTFSILKTKKEYFGIPERVSNQVDEALFLNQDRNECMLIVLQKPISQDFVFGTARMVRGTKESTTWKFKVSMEFTFERNYFNFYKDNNFESLSHLARYNVLTEGDVKRKGCEIDDEYWFEHLKK